MLVKLASRKEFLDFLQAPGIVERRDLQSTERVSTSYRHSDDVQLIWGEDDLRESDALGRASFRSLPRIIVVQVGKKRDFLAWVWTYIGEFRPLTAYTRVLDAEEVQPFLRPKTIPTLGALEEACLGLVLGEAATYVEGGQEKKPTITPLTCASTYSYAMARALAVSVGGDLDISDQGVPGTWMKARTVSKQRPLKLNQSELGLPWRLLLQLQSRSEEYRYSSRELPVSVYRACQNLYKGSDVEPETWEMFARDYPRLNEAKRAMQGPREGRVIFFEQFVVGLVEGRRGDLVLPSFLGGFLASQIGPGTLDYMTLLIPYLDQLPTALLWYGLCAGLQRRGSLYGFSATLGRRVLREILREETLFDIPQSDISLAELEALTADDTKGTDFRTGTQGLLAIEISPLVTATVRWPPKQPDQAELFGTEESVDDFRDLAIQLDDLRSKMAQIQKRITRIIEGRESSEWRAGRGRRR